jgi:hypothetical protein
MFKVKDRNLTWNPEGQKKKKNPYTLASHHEATLGTHK